MDPQTRSHSAQGRDEFHALPGPADPSGWAEVDGYELQRLLRRTPTHDVYLAYHRASHAYRELIVVQRLPGVDQAALRRAVEADVVAARALSHMGISPVEDHGVTRDGCLYVATARPVGRSLDEILAGEARLPVRQAFDLGHGLVTAVAVAHERGLAHGRLTPDRVVVVPSYAGWGERVVVLGFGTAAAQNGGLGPNVGREEQSPYTSPERAAGGPPTLPGDVFSLGSLILHMVTGSTPSVVRAERPLGERTSPAPPADAPTPGDFEQLVQRARAADPGRRYPSARELGAALWAVDTAWFEAQTKSPPPDARVASFTGSRGRRALVAAGVAGVLALGGAGLAWRSRAVPGPRSALDVTARETARSTPDQPVQRPSVVVAPPIVVTGPAPVPASPASPATPRAESRPVGPDRATVASAPSTAAPPVPNALPVERRPATIANPTTPGPVAQAAGTTNGSAVTERLPSAPTTASDSAAGEIAAAARPDARAVPPDIWAAVAEYANAIEARNLERLERVYPGMTDQQRRGWATFFGSVTDLRASLMPEQMTMAGANAIMRVRITFEYENERPHRAERRPVNTKLTLARDASGWRVRAVE